MFFMFYLINFFTVQGLKITIYRSLILQYFLLAQTQIESFFKSISIMILRMLSYAEPSAITVLYSVWYIV